MTARMKSLLIEVGIPLLMLASALGVAEYRIDKKEDASDHALDIQKLQSQQEATYSLLLDVRCQQEPNDRRCK